MSAAILLFILCAMTLVTGVSQQRFEWVASPADYGARLRAEGGWLRVIVAIDDLFVAAYVIATVALAERMARSGWRPLLIAVALAGVAAGVLDVMENHDLLAMLRWAELGERIPELRILERSELSQLKWMLGHLAFVAVGVSWPGQGPLDRVLRASLIAFQLPVGALVWTLSDPRAIELAIWVRYASFLSGLGVIAWMTGRRAVPAATAIGEPA